MTLQVHRVLDALRGVGSYPLLAPPGVPKSTYEELYQNIKDAEKFEFLDIPVEGVTINDEIPEYENAPYTSLKPEEQLDHTGGFWKLPVVTRDEREFWALRVLPLPAPICWFECTVMTRFGLLVVSSDEGWLVTRFDIVSGQVGWTTMQISAKYAHPKLENNFDIHVEIFGNERKMRYLKQNQGLLEAEAGNFWVAIYLALMVNSRSTDVVTEPAPARLNKRRIEREPLSAPLYEHRVVRIVPKRYVVNGEAGGGTHASPRLHWRRSHKRHFDRQTTGSVWVAHEIHNGVTGWFVGIVPRCLVGKRELGTITHEYRVA